MLVAAIGAALASTPAVASVPVQGKFQVRHVFVIVLENESAAVTFGPNSPARYLSKTLPARGEFVPNY
jgi:phosphatidylinositol-3-phosphatase